MSLDLKNPITTDNYLKIGLWSFTVIGVFSCFTFVNSWSSTVWSARISGAAFVFFYLITALYFAFLLDQNKTTEQDKDELGKILKKFQKGASKE